MAAVPYVEIKEAWLGGKKTQHYMKFDMGAMFSVLVEQQCDYRSLRDSSYQMFSEDTLSCRNAYPNDSDQNIVYSG